MPCPICFQFLIYILRNLIQTRLKNILRVSNKRNMADINWTQRRILNKTRMLHTSNWIHNELKPVSKVRSLAQIQTPSQVQSSPKIYTRWPIIGIVFRNKQRAFLLWLRTHESSYALCVPLLGILIALPAEYGKALCCQLQLVSLALFHVLGEDIFRLFLNDWQMDIELTCFV